MFGDKGYQSAGAGIVNPNDYANTQQLVRSESIPELIQALVSQALDLRAATRLIGEKLTGDFQDKDCASQGGAISVEGDIRQVRDILYEAIGNAYRIKIALGMDGTEGANSGRRK